jgi:hypothetical protein
MNTDLHLLGKPYAALEECHLNLVRNVRTSSEAVNRNSILANKGKALNQHFFRQGKSFSPFAFEDKFQISAGTFPQSAKSNAIVNLFGKCDQSCGQTHLAAVEWCVDNRIAIGANFLKHEVLHRRFGSDSAQYLGVLIALDSELIIASGMSSAVASASEYLVHYEELYQPMITSSLAVINLRD